MKTTEKPIEGFKETTKTLGQLNPSDTFRFHNVIFEEALREDLFFTVTSTKLQDGRIQVFNCATGELLVRDKGWVVIEHSAEMRVVR